MGDEFENMPTLGEGNEDPEVKEWIEAVIADSLPNDNLHLCLRDGTVLCKLLMTLQPSKYTHLKYYTQPKNNRECASNIQLFVEACNNLQVPAFEVEELLDCKNLYAVISAICTYGQVAQQAEFGNGENDEQEFELEREGSDENIEESTSSLDKSKRDNDKSKQLVKADSSKQVHKIDTKSKDRERERDREREKEREREREKERKKVKSSSSKSSGSSSSRSRDKRSEKKIPTRYSKEYPKRSTSSNTGSSSSGSTKYKKLKKELQTEIATYNKATLRKAKTVDKSRPQGVIPQVSREILDDIQKNLGRDRYIEAVKMRKYWDKAERINQAYSDFIKRKPCDWEAFVADVFG